MKSKLLMLMVTLSMGAGAYALELSGDISGEMQTLEVPAKKGFKKVPDVAQYKNASWDNVVGIARDISLEEAYAIAENKPEITFFFYTKGYQMVLENADGTYRLFRHGDTVFFSGEPWFGSAPGLADGYVKTSE